MTAYGQLLPQRVPPERYRWLMEYRAPTRIFAFVLAVVCGALLAQGHLLGGAITGLIALVLLALWKFADARGDDDRHTIW